jgi:hypothetical protein
MTVNASLDSATGTDVFVMKVDSLDGSPVFSVRLGGSDEDYGNAIAIDNEEDVHVTGTTTQRDNRLFLVHTIFEWHLGFLLISWRKWTRLLLRPRCWTRRMCLHHRCHGVRRLSLSITRKCNNIRRV